MTAKLQRLLLQKRQAEFPRLILEEAFPRQREFITDPSKLKVAFVLRRGGKSLGMGIYLLFLALSHPVTKSLYVGLTKESAENVMWLNIIEPLLLKHGIPYKFNKTRRLLQFQNKSTIQLTGADASPQQMSKYLGGKYILVCFDECQDITQDLKYWIEDKLGPAMVDYKDIDLGGTICCAGTAGRAIGRHWYHVTQPESPITHYSIHRWGAADNPFMTELLAEEMAKKQRETPGIEKTDGYRNQYLCEWVLDSTNRVYHNNTNNILTDEGIISSLMRRDPKWQFIIGCDFGYQDATAFVVAARSRYEWGLYIVETFKKNEMSTDETAAELERLQAQYKPVITVGDCQNLTLIDDLNKKYRCGIVAADKRGKEGHIASMNSDFITNKIRVIEHLNRHLLEEWAALTWNETKRAIGVFQEAPSKDNHAADACLYMHFRSLSWAEEPEPTPVDNSMRAITERRIRQQKESYQGAQSCESVYDEIDNLRGWN